MSFKLFKKNPRISRISFKKTRLLFRCLLKLLPIQRIYLVLQNILKKPDLWTMISHQWGPFKIFYKKSKFLLRKSLKVFRRFRLGNPICNEYYSWGGWTLIRGGCLTHLHSFNIKYSSSKRIDTFGPYFEREGSLFGICQARICIYLKHDNLNFYPAIKNGCNL